MSMMTIKMAGCFVATFLILALLLDGSFCDANGGGTGGGSGSGGAFGAGGSGSGSGAGGEFAGISVNNKINIVVRYETEDAASTDFFTTSLTSKFLESASKCNVVNWSFTPCAASKMDGDKLVCPKGEEQCKKDKIHACAAKSLAGDQVKFGEFACCTLGGKDAKQCAESSGMNFGDIQACADSKKGDTDCNDFYKMAASSANNEKTFLPAIYFTAKYNKDWNDKAYNDWNGTFCQVLKANNLKCPGVCP